MFSYQYFSDQILNIELKLDFSSVLAVILGLVIIGIIYNNLVDYLQRNKFDEGYLSLIVAGGVGFTLIGLAVISWQAAIAALVCFAASGSPMIIGSIVRYIRKRAENQFQIIERVADDMKGGNGSDV